MQSMIVILLSVLLGAAPAVAKPQSIAKQKKQAIARLKSRKAGFEKFQKFKKKWHQQRLARANDQKKIRQKYAQQREKARKSFRRKQQAFPQKAYRTFLAKRKRRNQQSKKAQQSFGKMQKQLKKIYQNKKYNIDGNKEFQL